MNNLSIKKVATVSGLFLGAFAFSVLAANWTEAPCAAPGCNTGAPINVTDTEQTKAGNLILNRSLSVGKDTKAIDGYNFDVSGFSIFDGIKVAGLTETTNLMVKSAGSDGNVLTRGVDGLAEWKAPANTGLTSLTVSTFQVIIPRGENNVTVRTATTDTAFLFCAISKMDNFANSDRDNSSCAVEKLTDGKWKITGKRGDDPDWVCAMTCFK